jgi:hypothetical protein
MEAGLLCSCYILHKFRCVCMIVVFESHYFLLFDVFFVFFSELEYFAHNKFSCNVFTFNSDLTCIQKDCWLISFFLLSCQKQLIWFNTAEIKLFISNVHRLNWANFGSVRETLLNGHQYLTPLVPDLLFCWDKSSFFFCFSSMSD